MRESDYPGEFIVFEGLDGSGQSTQVRLLEQYLERKGKKLLATKEPTLESDAGKEIAQVLSEKKALDPMRLQELFAEDRGEHLKREIVPALKKNITVISDRYFMSSLAFGAIDCDLEWLKKVNDSYLLPDVTFVLDVRPEVSLERITKRGKPQELFERLEKLEKARDNYKKLCSVYKSCFLVDGEQQPEKVHEDIVKIIELSTLY